MPYRESSAFCQVCDKQVLVRKETLSNTFHLLMCVFTCGLWAFVWIAANFFNLFAKYRCTQCGSQITSDYQQMSEATGGSKDTPIVSREPSAPSGFESRTVTVAIIVGFMCVLGLALVLFTLTNREGQTSNATSTSALRPASSYPPERIQKGEKLFNSIAVKYRMMIEFGWQAQYISLPIATDDWNKLSKDDQVNLTLYAESLVPQVRATPRKFVDRWKRRVQNLELPYDEFVSNASRICDECWRVEIGKPVKDIDGIWDIEGEKVISGSDVQQFRQLAEKGVVPASK